MVSEIKKNTEVKMNKSIDNFINNLGKIRTGRAHPGLLDHVLVKYYDSLVSISQVASVVVSDAKTITVQPWEAKMVAPIDKAIRDSDLGLNPITTGTVIRVPMPALTEERRKSLIKVVKSEAEEARISVRNLRRDANSELKQQLKSKVITEDDDKRIQDEIQHLTNKYIVEIDKLTSEKEKELLTV